MVGRVDGIIGGHPGIAGLDDKVAAVVIQAGAVEDDFVIIPKGIRVSLVAGREAPVFIIGNKQVGRGDVEKPSGQPFAGADTGADGVKQGALPVFFDEDILMRPGFAVGNSLAPGGLGDKFGQLHRG